MPYAFNGRRKEAERGKGGRRFAFLALNVLNNADDQIKLWKADVGRGPTRVTYVQMTQCWLHARSPKLLCQQCRG